MSQPFQRVRVQDYPAFAQVVAIAADVAVDAIVAAVGGQVDRRQRLIGTLQWCPAPFAGKPHEVKRINGNAFT